MSFQSQPIEFAKVELIKSMTWLFGAPIQYASLQFIYVHYNVIISYIIIIHAQLKSVKL